MTTPRSTSLPARLIGQAVTETYTGIAPIYDVWGRLTESKARRRCLEWAAIRDGEAVLEVAVGTGLTFAEILKRNPSGRNEGMDLTPAMLDRARRAQLPAECWQRIRSGASGWELRPDDLPRRDRVCRETVVEQAPPYLPGASRSAAAAACTHSCSPKAAPRPSQIALISARVSPSMRRRDDMV